MSAAAGQDSDGSTPRGPADLDATVRAALLGLLVAARELGAGEAWWETADGAARLVGDDGADAGTGTVLHLDASCGGRLHARLAWRAGAPGARLTGPGLAAIAAAGAALLEAAAEGRRWRVQAERLRDASRIASDWLWETDVEGRIVWMTDSISALTGREAGDEVGSRTLDNNRVRNDEYADSYRRYLEARAARQPFRGLVLDRATPGGTITVHINGDPFHDGDGRFAGYRGATRNVTAEVEARVQARQARSLLEQTIEGLPASVMISGPDDRVLMANQRWRRSAGRDLPAGCDTWTGMLLHHLRQGHYPDAGSEQDFLAWRRAQVEAGAAPVELRWRDRWLLSADQRLADGSVVHLTIDITERKQAQQALEQALRDKQAAEMVNRSTSEFLSRLSHEMRTPLNAVLGFAELMRGRGEYRADHLAYIVAAGQQLLRLIDDVLDLQQVEQGALALRAEAVQASVLVDEVAAMLGPQAAGQRVTQRGPAATPLRLRADARRLRQVLLNIGANAIKYNRPGGEVVWSIDDTPGSPAAAIVVEDTGEGLDEQQLARLFRPFERLGRETRASDGGEGSGLGLVISRRLAEAMGGALILRSTPGRGTRVEIRLPRAGADEGAPAAGAAAEAPPHRVLYIEDNPVNAALFEEALRDEPGLALRVVADGDEAVHVVGHWRPDLLVIDMHLAGDDGHRVLARLRLLPGLADVPAVMCSADALPEDRARARAAGFVAYWTKPVAIDAMRAELRALLAARAARAA